jgi:hypothetical protein
LENPFAAENKKGAQGAPFFRIESAKITFS